MDYIEVLDFGLGMQMHLNPMMNASRCGFEEKVKRTVLFESGFYPM